MKREVCELVGAGVIRRVVKKSFQANHGKHAHVGTVPPSVPCFPSHTLGAFGNSPIWDQEDKFPYRNLVRTGGQNFVR